MGMCKVWSSPGAPGPVGETGLNAKYLEGGAAPCGLAPEEGFLGGEARGPSEAGSVRADV